MQTGGGAGCVGERRIARLIVDVETTGLHPGRGARIVEIAWMLVAGTRLEEARCLVEGGEAGELPGGFACGPLEVEDGALWSALVARFAAHGIAGHHVAFDLGFLRRACLRVGVAWPRVCTIDTCALARQRWPGRRSYALSALAAEEGLGGEAAARFKSAQDVVLTRALLERLERSGGPARPTPLGWAF